MSCEISPNPYRDLSPDNIRLLRLLPSENKNAPIECELFNYSLEHSDERTHPYEALSYVWGHSYKHRSISIGKYYLPVTDNLHDALSRLRYRSFGRIIWVDAICINQENIIEKQQQIQLMAKIYGVASRVVVWLGAAEADSDLAIKEIRAAGGNKLKNFSNNEAIRQAVLALLQRPWFSRIWVWRYILDIHGYY